jgi:peptidoglycan/xylan/chitin deacetylase (PgdA/CDA1 family)
VTTIAADQPVPATATTPQSFVALMYHNVAPDGETYPDLSPSATSYFVSRAAFEQQLKRITAAGASFMTADALAPFYSADRPAHPHPGAGRHVLLTFDDGWADGVHVGGPVLQAAGAQALLFITTDFLGKPRFLTRPDLARLDPGTFRVGSHARSHRMLSLLPEDEIRSELSDSKKFLEDALGHEVETISIPSGAVDRRVRRIAAECGYRFVFDSEVHVNRRGDSPLAIARVAIMHDTGPGAIDRYVNYRVTRERVRRAVLQGPKRLLGLKRYERLRRTLLGEKRDQKVTHQS